MAAMNPSSPRLEATVRPASVISAFVTEYTANWKFYKKVSAVAKDVCEEGLKEFLINATVTPPRAKHPNSLEKKLRNHPKKDEYKTKYDIKANIVDLCGVRIVIQSRRDQIAIQEMLHDKFVVIKEKDHPDLSGPSRLLSPNKPQEEGVYQKRFHSYVATHYHVNLKRQDEIQHDLGDAKGSIIEIQVRTPMHDRAATLEHPLYKSGSASNPRLVARANLISGYGTFFEALEEDFEMDVAEQEAKENRGFETYNDLGLFIEEWMSKEAEVWVKAVPKVPSCKAFLYLLQLEYFRSMNSQREVRKQLHVCFSERSVYDQICSLYEIANLKTIGFIVDRILLTDDGKPKVPLPTYEDIDKIHVIMNTIRWLDKLFEPSLTWTLAFDASLEGRMLFNSLYWLIHTGHRLQNKGQLNAVDTMHVEALWGWFEAQNARQIQLTFTMSRCGINREEEDITMIEKLMYGLAWLS